MAAPPVNGAYPKAAASGYVANVEIGDEKNQADYYDKANHYDTLWGMDNIHLGYYPHLADKTAIPLTFPQAGAALTRRMLALAQIDSKSKVLDLGCGKGLACKEIAELTGAACTGVDLSPENIVRGNQIAKENPHLKLDFLVGSFTEIGEDLVKRGYTHVFSQVAFCHVHSMLPLTLSEVKKILDTGAVAVVNDYMGSDKEQSQMTR